MEKTGTTFPDLYRRVKAMPQEFLAEIATLTKRSVRTVEQWAQGSRQPDALARQVISERFGIKESELFPEVKPQKD